MNYLLQNHSAVDAHISDMAGLGSGFKPTDEEGQFDDNNM